FGDTAGTTHVASIDCLKWWGVTSGLTATRFQPGGNVTRGQMATFLATWIDDVANRGSGRPLGSNTDEPFTDVPDGHTHRSNIARLYQAGVISGTSPTTYAPNAPVTRAQTASLVRGAVEYVTGGKLAAGRDTFIDDNTSPHEGSIDRLSNVGVISGTRAFEYTPAAPVSRGAMASLVMRASDLLVEQGRVSPPR
ncbi:MAG: S-layer homology domain-containing protein, partial [Nitriliruptor sp.]